MELEIIDQDGTPTTFSAHSSQELCFIVAISRMNFTPVVSVQFEGSQGEIGVKPAVAGGGTPVCFTAPPVPDAGQWQGCTPPRDSISEGYLVSAKFDATGTGAEEAAEADGLEPTSFVWEVERQVTKKNAKPEACQEIDGEWTWTFQSGQLECRKLPMKVALPGFAEQVAIQTDGEGLDGLTMLVDGGAAGERLRLVREADVSRRGRDVPAFEGYQDISGLLDQGGGSRGKYSLAVLSPKRIEGRLEVKEARVQGDTCSISWPFHVTR